MNRTAQGYIKVPGGKVWYQVIGEKSQAPLIVLHGGPGFPHNYLQPLDFFSNQRKVIFYDQLGCGKSDRPTDKKLWRVERFVEELNTIVNTLKLDSYHVLGQSWGAALAVSFALQKPKGLLSLILADPYLGTPTWMRDTKRMIHQLPDDVAKTIFTYIKDRRETKEYKTAKAVFYYRFVRRYKKAPPEVLRSREGKNDDLYEYMWGPEEYILSGTLIDFDLTPKLSEISLPVLLLCGRFDEATPEAMFSFQKLFPNAEVKIFEKSAHFPHLTEKKAYLQTVSTFLQKTDLKYT